MRLSHEARSERIPSVPRWHARYQASVSADIAGSEVLLYHPIEDLSLGGACVETPVVEPTGSRVDVTLSFGKTGPTMHIPAEVAWAQRGSPGRMGLRWLGLSARQRRRLSECLASIPARAISAPGDARERPRA